MSDIALGVLLIFGTGLAICLLVLTFCLVVDAIRHGP